MISLGSAGIKAVPVGSHCVLLVHSSSQKVATSMYVGQICFSGLPEVGVYECQLVIIGPLNTISFDGA